MGTDSSVMCRLIPLELASQSFVLIATSLHSKMPDVKQVTKRHSLGVSSGGLAPLWEPQGMPSVLSLILGTSVTLGTSIPRSSFSYFGSCPCFLSAYKEKGTTVTDEMKNGSQEYNSKYDSRYPSTNWFVCEYHPVRI
jgi:hypothetical protein